MRGQQNKASIFKIHRRSLDPTAETIESAAGPVRRSEHKDGTIIYALEKDGRPHREDGPAIETAGGQKWYYRGQLHREDGPAIVDSDGGQAWYRNGKKHREDGPAVKAPDGSEEWCRNDKHHRIDGPAIKRADGTVLWYQQGNPHRLDGPAVETTDGRVRFFLEGEELSKEEHARRTFKPRLDGNKKGRLLYN
jgi:hypothetical protein